MEKLETNSITYSSVCPVWVTLSVFIAQTSNLPFWNSQNMKIAIMANMMQIFANLQKKIFNSTRDQSINLNVTTTHP